MVVVESTRIVAKSLKEERICLSREGASNESFIAAVRRTFPLRPRTGVAGAMELLECDSSGTRSGGAPLLEALPTEDWPALRGLEWHRGFLAAAGTVGPGLHFGTTAARGRAQCGRPFALAGLATLGFVLKLLIVEEKLFPGCEDEVSAAVNAFQNLVLEFHGRDAPFSPRSRARDEGKLQLSAGPD